MIQQDNNLSQTSNVSNQQPKILQGCWPSEPPELHVTERLDTEKQTKRRDSTTSSAEGGCRESLRMFVTDNRQNKIKKERNMMLLKLWAY